MTTRRDRRPIVEPASLAARVPVDGLVILAGLPGSGKSTLLRQAVRLDEMTVLDSADVQVRWAARLPARLPYPWYRPLVHTAHRLAIARAALRPGPLLAHEPATRPTTRALLVLIGWVARRRRHFVWLSCPPEVAAAGQAARGRALHARSFSRHVRRAARVERLLGRGGLRGWHTTETLRRPAADEVLTLKQDGQPHFVHRNAPPVRW